MTVATPVDTVVNPNDTSQYYTLWTTGRIDAGGGAPLITSGPDWYSRFDPPGVAIWITNWATGAGWVLDYRGGFNALNGATHANVSGTVMSGIPITASPRVAQFVDWSWDPAGTGQGYVLDAYGKIWPFGGASAPPRTGTRWGSKMAKKLQMQWSPTKKAATVDKYGKTYADFTGTVGTVASTLGSPRSDVVRDFVVMDWAATPASGYILDLTGAMHVFGTRTRPMGWPYKAGGDLARTLGVISSSNPESFREVWAGGQVYEFVSSTPPTVIAGGVDPISPAATETTSTRPDLRWEYSDPQNDEQAEWQVLVFDQAFATGHDMTDPLVWTASALVALDGTDRNARGVTSPVDFPNGTYRMYVRAKDTALQWSAWANYGWTQNVAAPPTPTSFTATANQATATVSLSVGTSAGTADTVKFEYSEDGGTTWKLVRGAEAIPRITTTTATAYDPPIGTVRQYRARTYSTNPRVLSAASGTQTATITQVPYHWLTSVDNPALGGKVNVSNLIEWTRPFTAGVFEGLGAKYPTVIDDGSGPKARRGNLNLLALDAAGWTVIEQLMEGGGVLVHRDPLGHVVYFKPVGDWTQARMSPMESLYSSGFPLVEVEPPILAV